MPQTNDELARMIASYTDAFRKQYATVSSPLESTTVPDPSDAKTTEIPHAELTDIGSLQVRVSTENQAFPIIGATVLVTRDSNGTTELIRSMITDENGTTELIDLPTKDRSLSLSPNNDAPYALYDIQISADGYFTKRFLSQPIYGGVTAIQNVSMIPLPEAADNTTVLPYSTDKGVITEGVENYAE